MIKRLFWLGLGLAAGAIVVHQVAKRARALTPGGIADNARKSAVGVVGSARSFVSDVFENMHDREAEIHDAIAAGQVLEYDDGEEDEYDEFNGEDGRRR